MVPKKKSTVQSVHKLQQITRLGDLLWATRGTIRGILKIMTFLGGNFLHKKSVLILLMVSAVVTVWLNFKKWGLLKGLLNF